MKTAVKITLALCLSVGFAMGQESKFTDSRDSSVYRTVKIGKQTWMAQNLDYKTGVSWCYENDWSNCDKYGRLYDWNTAKAACPSGWHLPNKTDWDSLIVAVGGIADTSNDNLTITRRDRKSKQVIADVRIRDTIRIIDTVRVADTIGTKYRYYAAVGKKLKSKTGWNDNKGASGGGTDDFGFSALPNGHRRSGHFGGGFYDAGGSGYWWSATEGENGSAYSRSMSFYYDNKSMYYYDKVFERPYSNDYGFAVRCVKE